MEDKIVSQVLEKLKAMPTELTQADIDAIRLTTPDFPTAAPKHFTLAVEAGPISGGALYGIGCRLLPCMDGPTAKMARAIWMAAAVQSSHDIRVGNFSSVLTGADFKLHFELCAA